MSVTVHFLRRQLQRMHRDERGAISVLVLLTIWCLVALLAMVWNTTEQAAHRQKVQTAADSAAHSAATWMGRKRQRHYRPKYGDLPGCLHRNDLARHPSPPIRRSPIASPRKSPWPSR